jgi:5-deoxy-D-glucuronate isomerase
MAFLAASIVVVTVPVLSAALRAPFSAERPNEITRAPESTEQWVKPAELDEVAVIQLGLAAMASRTVVEIAAEKTAANAPLFRVNDRRYSSYPPTRQRNHHSGESQD